MATPQQSNPWLSMLQGQQDPNLVPNSPLDPQAQAMLNMQAASPEPQAPAPQPEAPSWLDQIAPAGQPQQQGDNGALLKNLMGQLSTKNTEGFGIQKDALDRLKSYRDQLAGGQNKLDLTPLMALADAWNPGSKLTASYKAPMSAQERQGAVAGVDQELAKDAGSMTSEEMGALKDKLMGGIAAEKFGGGGPQAQKVTSEDQKAAQTFESKLAGDTASSRSAYGAAATRVAAAQRANQILAGSKNYNDISPQNVHELAISLNSILAPGNPNVTMYEDIVPKSARGSAASLENWLTNKPGGANQGEFVKNIANTIQREQMQSQNFVKNYIQTRGGGVAGMAWAKRNPDLFRSILTAHLNSTTAGGPGFGDSSQASGFKAGDVREKDGIKYQRDTNGNWSPI